MPETYPQDLLVKHYLKRRPKRKNRAGAVKHHKLREKMEMVEACIQQATRIPDKASFTVDPSGTKKQRTTEGDMEEDGGEGPERKRSLL
ncbi:hypothetical protein ElyMa_004607400 [Elysia marginata]|uniref:Uncharacterized protein n=1 Tax=Elysia marginata TaxID=1093978 RepID=A0AAV4HYF8_9GAST|nr:hypothetical protein ElyMa_004607400 [Elysia marginata]